MSTNDTREPAAAKSAEPQVSGFERAIEGLRAAGGSDAMRELVELLARHGADEGRILAELELVGTATSDPAARYLIDLILSDERRHHRTLVEIATSIAWQTLGSLETSVPPLGWHIDEELLPVIRRLRGYEESDERELRTLRQQLQPFEQTTLWGLLVDLMILDTKKHAAILAFLERHARDD